MNQERREGASLPAARGGVLGCTSMRRLKSIILRFAMVFSEAGTAPVFFSKACSKTIRLPDREDSVARIREPDPQLAQFALDLRENRAEAPQALAR